MNRVINDGNKGSGSSGREQVGGWVVSCGVQVARGGVYRWVVIEVSMQG